MKIAYVITRSDTFGGAHIHVRDLALSLLRLGHDVTILVGQEGPFTDDLQAVGVPYRALRYLVREIRPNVDFYGLLEIRKTLSMLRPDLIAAHSSKAGWLGRLAGRSLGIPTIFTAHGWAFTEGVSRSRRKLYALAERLAAPLAARIITVSEYDRRLALECNITKRQNIVTVHNGVCDIPRHLFSSPKDDAPRIIMVARFDVPKNHAMLFRALAGLINLKWHLDLVGDGPLRGRIERLATDLRITDRVRFLGERKDVAECLSVSQLFVLVSDWEGFPLSILEAMRAELPVIASDVGGVKEAIVDGKTGFLVPRADVDILRDRFYRLLTDSVLRADMGEAGRKRYEAEFTMDKMVSATMGVYQKVLAEC